MYLLCEQSSLFKSREESTPFVRRKRHQSSLSSFGCEFGGSIMSDRNPKRIVLAE